MTIRKGETSLDSLETWGRLAGPKSPDQWKDYRSAKECARAWLENGGCFPSELRHMLEAHGDFGEIVEWKAEPEAQVPFDEFGGPANIDVLVEARDERGGLVVAVEAKADESFGPYVSRALSAALERRLQSSASRGLDRLEALAANVLGPRSRGDPPLHQIRYQLVTACAAALSKAEAQGASRAVVAVHEFETPATAEKRRARNTRDLLQFLHRLGIEEPTVISTGMVGPILVPGGARFPDPCPLYIGKVTRQVPVRDD